MLTVTLKAELVHACGGRSSGYAREMSMLHSLSLDRLDARVGYDDRYVREKGDALRSLPRALDDVSSEQARGLDLSPPLS